MARSAAVLLAACLVALSGYASADTTGASLNSYGYTFGSDITGRRPPPPERLPSPPALPPLHTVPSGYLDISQDVCDITTAIDAADFATAAAIYTVGQNSVRSDGTKRTLAAWAEGGEDDEPHWGLYARYFNDSAWLNTFITAGLEGTAPWTVEDARKQIVKKGIQSNLQAAYMFHEVDEAAEAVEAGEIDPLEGAPHVVDEGAAIYFGTKCAGGSIADVAIKRAKAFGTMVADASGACVAPTNVAVAEAFKGLQAAAVAGDAAAYEAATAALEKQIVTIFTQITAAFVATLDAYGITAAELGTLDAVSACATDDALLALSA
ncbi:expressed protein [Chlorella variabilis]|uniref:Expressed protein n=1 Tax=Chlorella variabilis TaxID=554065 RepID=E1ZBW4_CHLVA|nr:expressed protein [Chlorella variabilis]EFN56499.1 expressed protein [Chlorella variabilis]|eukprot:XP_005848601.1 expressed protein [Chlorella variabilis]